MSIEKITEKIRAEATADATSLLAKVVEENQAALNKARTQAESIQKESVTKAEAEAKLLLERKESVAQLEAKKLRLAVKQEIISLCFDHALDRLASMDQTASVSFLVKAMLSTGMTSGEAIFNEKDKTSLGQQVVDQVNETLSRNGKVTDSEKITLSSGTIQAKGGFILKKGSFEVNSTLETMIDSVRDQLTPQVVEALF